jgi:hypothetical protein
VFIASWIATLFCFFVLGVLLELHSRARVAQGRFAFGVCDDRAAMLAYFAACASEQNFAMMRIVETTESAFQCFAVWAKFFDARRAVDVMQYTDALVVACVISTREW